MASAGAQDKSGLAELDRLVALYKSYNLPLPPASAPLVYVDGMSKNIVVYGYLIRRRSRDKEPLIWVGTTVIHRDAGPELYAPSRTTEGIFLLHVSTTVFPEEWHLAMAVIERTRGHNAFALKLLESVKNQSLHTTNRELRPSTEDSLDKRMALLAIGHWMNDILRPGSDRSYIARQMEHVVTTRPDARSEFVDETLAALHLTVSQPRGVTTNEQLVDSLLESEVPGGRLSSGTLTLQPEYLTVRAVVEHGFAIVPTLIEHLNDNRLTRAFHQGMMNAPSTLCSVGDICAYLLNGMIGNGGGEWVGGPDMDFRNHLRSQWELVRKVGESEYVLQQLIKPNPSRPNEFAVLIAKSQRPETLIPAYRHILDRDPYTYTDSILKAMREVMGSGPRFLAELNRGIENDKLIHLCAALEQLQELNQYLFDLQLMRILKRLLAEDNPNPIRWLNREETLARLVGASESSQVWDAFLDFTRRVDDEKKATYIEWASYGSCSPVPNRQWLLYLLKCMPHASERFERVLVLTAAQALKMDYFVRYDDGNASYRALRSKVIERPKGAKSFSGVAANHWAAGAIQSMRDEGILVGYPRSENFTPTATTRRAQ